MNSKIRSSRCAPTDPPTFENPQQIYPVLFALFDKMFPVLLAIGGLALAASLYRATVRSGWYPDFILHAGVYLALTVIFVFRRRVPVPLLFWLLLLGSYVIALQSLFSLGLAGTGLMHLIFLCTFAGVFLGKRTGLITLTIGAVAIFFIGSGICAGFITTRPEMAGYLLSPSNWTIQILCYLTYLIPLVLSVNALQKNMAESLNKLKINNRQLEAEISRRGQAEEALRKSEERLRQVIDLVPHFIYARDRNGRFILVNKACADAFGTTVEDLVGKADADFNPNREEVEQFLRDDRQVINSGQPMEIPEEKVSGSKGCSRILQTIKIPFIVSSTGDEAVLGVSTDITVRKGAEEASKESERRFREFADLLPQAVAEFDIKGNFTYGNLRGFEMFGYTQKDFDEETYNFAQMFIPGDLERLGSNIQSLFNGRKGSTNNEYTALRKDGSTFPAILYASPIIRQGKPAGLRAIAIDNTERKTIEQALRESEAKYRSVVESSLAGFFILQDNVFRFVNQRGRRILGYRDEEVGDIKNPLDLVHPDDRTMVEKNIEKCLRGDQDLVDEYDVRMIRKDGQVVTVKVFGGLMHYDGRAAISGTFIDLTREKTLESNLRQAQKMEAVGQLAGGIAHDFNNILTSLVGYASLLQVKMEATNPLQAYVDQMLSASQKATSLTKRLLTFSRKQTATPKLTDMNTIIRGTEALLKRLLTEDIVLETLFSPDDLTILVDTTQIDQILFNLVTNARDSMPGGGKIIIETKQAVLDNDFLLIHGFGEPGRYALLSISDTGLGMGEKTREKIFEPFFTTKETGKGTGLGLATVYGIIKQHKGYVTVYSEQNIGTTFHIYFPMAERKIDREEPAAFNLKKGKETILVAEDNEEVRRFVTEILTLYGYNIIEAVDGDDAVNQFQKDKTIDLVVLDSIMPKKNGREVYDEIIKIKPGVKALFMSGYAKDILFDKGLPEKEFAFISKPLLPDELLQMIREMMDR